MGWEGVVNGMDYDGKRGLEGQERRVVNEERITRMCGMLCELRWPEWKGNERSESDEMSRNECDNKEGSMRSNNRKPYVM